MKVLQEINIMEDKKKVIWLNVLAFPLFFLFFWLFNGLAMLINPVAEFSFSFGIFQLLLFLLSIIAVLVIHEFIHGIFFKFFKPENKVVFGIKWKSGMAYATSPGSRYPKGQMLVIGLAPFIVWTSIFTVLFAVKWLSLPAYVALASIHAAGCVGDFYYVYLLFIKYRGKKILAEDTETGLIIYEQEKA